MKQGQFNSQPILHSSLLTVRPLQSADRDALFDVASDPLIWIQHPNSNRYLRSEFDVFFDQALQSKGALLIIDAQANVVIGSSRYFGFDPDLSQVEIGWTFLARSHWGGQYNSELKRLMLNYAFNYVSTVVFYIGKYNLRSQSAVEKLAAVKARHLDKQGRLIYRLTKKSWLQKHNENPS